MLCNLNHRCVRPLEEQTFQCEPTDAQSVPVLKRALLTLTGCKTRPTPDQRLTRKAVKALATQPRWLLRPSTPRKRRGSAVGRPRCSMSPAVHVRVHTGRRGGSEVVAVVLRESEGKPIESLHRA